MKHLLLTTIAAVLLVGCGPSVPDISIHKAAEEGNIEAVKQHLAAGTDVNARGGIGETPLHSAAYYGHKVVAELLIAEGADVNAKTEDGVTPLDFAKRHPEIADLLRKHGGNDAWGPMPTKDEVANWPILETKTYKKELSPKSLKSQTRVFLLLQNNLNLDIDIIWLDFDGKPQSYGIIKAGEGRIINTFSTHRWLLKDKLYVTPEFSARIKLHSKTGAELSIHKAAEAGNIEAVKQHLAAGANVNAKDEDGATPLHLAYENGNGEVVKYLVEKGANLNAKTKGGQTLLHIAAYEGRNKTIELLVKKGAEVNPLITLTGSFNGMTPLDFAIRQNKSKTADLLRKHGGKTGEELKAEGK